MTSFIFDTCCGCIELRTGCLIIGYLNLIIGIIGIIITALMALGAGLVINDTDVRQELEKAEINPSTLSTAAVVVAVILIILLVLYLTFNIVFLVGVHQNKRGHVKAYLVYCVIFLVIYILMFFAGFANPPITAQDVCSKIFTILLNLYFLLVIRSYYYKMNDASRQPAIYNTA